MRAVRWGRVSEIRQITKIGDDAYRRAPRRLKHLASWRGLHRVASHQSIRRAARRQGIKPSSNLPLKAKVELLRKRQKT